MLSIFEGLIDCWVVKNVLELVSELIEVNGPILDICTILLLQKVENVIDFVLQTIFIIIDCIDNILDSINCISDSIFESLVVRQSVADVVNSSLSVIESILDDFVVGELVDNVVKEIAINVIFIEGIIDDILKVVALRTVKSVVDRIIGIVKGILDVIVVQKVISLILQIIDVDVVDFVGGIVDRISSVIEALGRDRSGEDQKFL